MLVVVTIVAVLLGIGAKTMKNATTARGVSTAVPIAESVFAEARGLAKGRGDNVYVVIYADTTDQDPENHEKLFRYIGVATRPEDADGNEILGEPLRLTSRGTTLPSQTFYNANLSGMATEETQQCLFPGSSDPRECYAYKFNAEGILVEPNQNTGGDEPNGIFVVQSGMLAPGQEVPRKLPTQSKDVGGFAIWKSGNTSVFRSPNQIPNVSSDLDADFE